MIEVERKFRLQPEQKESLEGNLQEEYGPIEPVHQIDEVFLQGINSFADFKRGMPVMRLRTVNGATELAYKRSINEQGDTVEYELSIGSVAIMRKILDEMDYRPVTVVDKVRLEVKAGDYNLTLDTVKDAGNFMEIEMLVEDESMQPEAERRILEKAVSMGLAESAIEARKYDQLVSMPPTEEARH